MELGGNTPAFINRIKADPVRQQTGILRAQFRLFTTPVKQDRAGMVFDHIASPGVVQIYTGNVTV